MRKRFEVWFSDRFWRTRELQATYARKIPAIAKATQIARVMGKRHVVIDRAARVGMAWKHLIERDGTLLGWETRGDDTTAAARTEERCRTK